MARQMNTSLPFLEEASFFAHSHELWLALRRHATPCPRGMVSVRRKERALPDLPMQTRGKTAEAMRTLLER